MNKSGIIPLGDRCIIEVIKEDEVTAGGVYRPPSEIDATENRKAEAILLESGEAVKSLCAIWPENGTIVFITPYAGVKYQPTDNDPHYRIVNWEDIVGYRQEKES